MVHSIRPKKKLIGSQKVLIVALLCGAFFLFNLVWINPVRAAEITTAEQTGLTANEGFGEAALGKQDVVATVASIINIVLGVLGIIAVGLIVYAGFIWMTAGGNAEKVEKAKLILRNAAIGLAIIMASWGIAAFVISRLSAASGIDTGAGGGGGGGGGGGIGGEQFSLQEFQTSHAGAASRDDVYLCSDIQSRFNHWLNLQSVDTARGLPQQFKLAVRKTGALSATVPGQYDATTPEQLTIDIRAGSNILGFTPPGTTVATRGDWPINSQFEIHVPKSLADTSDETLADCTALGCNDRTTYFSWDFTTTDKRDEIKPTLSSAYPRLPGDIQGYPDRDVDRSITFTLNFSEDIDFFTAVREDGRLNPENIKIEQVASGEPNAAVTAAVPTENFDVSASGTGLQFALNQSHQSSLNDGPYLEPYTWYRITAQGLTDLCGNPLDRGPVQWIFQTNGNIPGVAFVYPADKYQFACPSTEAFVQFRTSMYDIKTSSCLVPKDAANAANGGLVRSGQGIDGRTLLVSDDKPPDDPDNENAAPINPNNFCKRYDFAPASQALAVDTEYKPEVSYRNPANDAQTENVNWSFMVKPANQCANAPYISALSPSTGPWGRCLTVQGNYFANKVGGDGGDTNRNGSDAFVQLDLDSVRNQMPTGNVDGDAIQNNWTNNADYKNGLPLTVANDNWFNTYLTDEMPNVAVIERADRVKLVPPGTGYKPIIDFNFFVVRRAGGAIGDLTSNPASFAVPIKDDPYQGPCLYSLQPNVGKWQDPVILRGIKFLPLNQKTKTTAEDVFFNDDILLANTDVNGWQAEEIRTVVPDGALDGLLVKVRTSAGLSNGLKFDVANGRGGPCQSTDDCAVPQICSQGRCVDPPPPAGFRIEQANPTAACSAACANAEVSVITNKAIKPEAAVAAAFTGEARQSGALDIRECLSENCQSLGAHQTFIPHLALDDKKLIFANFTLVAGKRYRVIVYGGVSGLAASDSDKQLANLNYDADANGVPDSYSWYFTVGVNDCAVDRIDTAPPSLGFYEGDPSEKVSGTAYGKPDSCSSEGQVLNVTAGFEWKSCKYTVGDIRSECIKTCATAEVATNKGIIGIIGFAPDNAAETLVSGANGTKAGARALACLFYGAGAIKDATVVTVRSRCETDAQCNLSDDMDTTNDCPGSTCNLQGPNASRCTPVINNFSPADGAPGTWVSLNGCYFGNQWGQVKFNNAADFLPPGGACGITWSDKQIIAEAPAGIMGSGKLKVTENRIQDAQSAESAAVFTVNDTVHPGLCKVEPDYDKVGASVKLVGKNFGNIRNATNDRVEFIDTATTPRFPTTASTVINGWKDAVIEAVVVPQIPLLGLKELWTAVQVVKALITSNVVNFRVIETPAGQPPPTATDLRASSYQPGDNKLACLNIIAQVSFDGLVDRSSLTLGHTASTTPNKFMVRRIDASVSPPAGGGEGGVGVAGEVWLDYPSPASTILSFIPDESFAKNAQYQIVLKSGTNGLRSTTGGQLRAGGPCADLTGGQCAIGFTTISGTASENAQCAAAGLNIIPTNPYFTCAGEGCEGDFQPTVAGHQRQFRAVLEAKNGQSLSPAGAGFIWSSADAGIVALPTPLPATKEITATIGNKNGISRVSAVLSGTESEPKPIEGASDVTVFLCDNPWPALTNGIFTPYRDSAGDRAANFSTYYCRDRGAADTSDDLPLFTGPVVNTARQGVDDLLKELFFTEAVSKDAIGIRVLTNFPHYSTGEWYNRQVFTKGAPSPLTIDGYEALRDGRTVYVSAPNLGSYNLLYTNVYLLSYSDGANPDTVNIVNQMVENMSFAVNIANPLDKDKLRRDVKRWTDALILSGALAAESAPPKLQSGTFIAGKSVSVWPSWQETLGKALGGRLPIDPINTLACPTEYDQKTCFDKKLSPKFKCQTGSQAYFYRYVPPSAGSKDLGTSILGLTLEYADPSRWNGLLDPWFSVTPTESWCANLEYRQEYE